MTTTQPLISGRDISVTTLDNGIRVVSERLPYVRSVAAGVWIGSGSRLETREENGISHFIEHMLFKGTHNRSAEEIAFAMDSLGGHMDAYTSRELVSYNVKVLDERLPEAFDVISDLVLNPLFQPEDIEKEKGVILEELKMEFDNPEYLVHDLFVKNFWGDHSLGRAIIGTADTIRSFDEPMLRGYYERIYVPENLTITIAGNVEHAHAVDLASQVFHKLGTTGFRNELPVPSATPFFELKHKDALEQVHVLMGVRSYPMNDPRRYAAYVLSTILGGGMSSRLFQNIREKRGLAYAVFSELNLYRDTGTMQLYAGTGPETARDVVLLMLEEMRQLKNEVVPEVELRRAKDNLKGATALSMEGTSARMSNLARQALFQDRFFSIDEMMQQIEAVTAEEVRAVAQDCFQTDALGLAMLGRVQDIDLKPADVAC